MASRDRITGDISQNDQSNSYDGRIARGHTIHAIVEIGAVADSSHDKDSKQHKENPCKVVHPLGTSPLEQVSIIEVVVFQERDGGFRRLHIGTLHHDFLVVLNLQLDRLIDLHRRAETQGQADEQTEQNLSAQFHRWLQSVFLASKGLHEIIGKT